MDESSAAIPTIVVETYYRPILEQERKQFLKEIAWRRADNSHSTDSFAFQKMNPQIEAEFVGSSNDAINCYPVTNDNWSSEQVLVGDYAMRSMGSDGLPEGYLTFGLLNNGDAIIMQVQGKKDRRFTPEKQNLLVQNTLSFLSSIGTKRVFLVSGSILNSMRKSPNSDLSKRYVDIAKANRFNNDMWGLPYVDLN